MPGTFPAGAPVLTGDSLAISRFLQSPTALKRRLRDYGDLRFVSDQILTQRFRSSGGAVLYEMTEPFVSDRAVESVGAGSEYPYANLPTGTAAVAAIQKWGQKVLLTDEEIERNAYGGAAVDRQLRKVINSIISQVDSITMSAIASAVTATFNVTAAGGGVWTGATPTILRDILRAKAAIYALNLGYHPDTVVLNDTQYAYAMTDTAITNAWRRETTTNPVYSGQVETIAGLNVIVSPNLPAATAYVLDSSALGGMADEMDGAPGYSVTDLAVQVKSIRRDENDAWDLQGRRKTVPVVQEPGAAIKLTVIGI
jgi:hypothetical protein